MVKSSQRDFDRNETLKTKPEDSFFNIQSILYISANQITKILFYTNITPHQVILLSLIFGIGSAFLITSNNLGLRIIGALLLFYKNVLDKVDGSLARAKGLDSRRGRFYDSISDFIVNLAIFTSISFCLYSKYQSIWIYPLVYLAMISSMFQCSYFIFYQVSFIKQSGKKTVNRLIESITDEDRMNHDKLTLFMQRIFQIIYGWQDSLIFKLDKQIRNNLINSKPADEIEKFWFTNKKFLNLASFLSIGTHMVLIAICAVFNIFEVYLLVNLILLNLLLIYSIIYHYKSIKNKIKDK